MSPVKYFLPVLILTLGITGCENTISGNGASKSGNSASQPEDSASQPGDSTFQPDYSSPQIAEIRAKWNQYKPADEGDAYYAQTPKVTAPYEAGSLTQAHLNDGLKMTRFIRYLAGLSENVYLVDGLNEQAQYGAVLLAALDTLSHAPPKPADMDDAFYQKGKTSCASSNLYVAGSKLNLYNREDLDRVVRTFIHDTDATNYTHVGHRRWILHPSLQNLGFGLAQRLVVRDGQSMEAYFAAMQIADTSNTTDKVDTAYVAWPGEGYFPESFFSGEQAWSVSLNPKIY
ncbi:MAG: hypothetical protein LBT16_13520, partial [Treponema sp.]|nr:hypothetical protein [Treponema sp.]